MLNGVDANRRDPPELASLKAMYAHSRTREQPQSVPCKMLSIVPMREHQRRALVTALRQEFKRSGDTDQLIAFARSTSYRWKLFIPRDRDLRAMVSAALFALEQTTCTMILGDSRDKSRNDHAIQFQFKLP